MEENKLVFGKKNYTLLIASIAVLILGFIVMSLDQELYGFGFLGLTLGPIIVFIGFLIPFFAIFTKAESK